jgi:hypothetical protein
MCIHLHVHVYNLHVQSMIRYSLLNFQVSVNVVRLFSNSGIDRDIYELPGIEV